MLVHKSRCFCDYNVRTHENLLQVSSSLGKRIADIPEGSRVGLSLDINRDLLLYLNGVCQGTVVNCVAKPAYFACDLCLPYRKVIQV